MKQRLPSDMLMTVRKVGCNVLNADFQLARNRGVNAGSRGNRLSRRLAHRLKERIAACEWLPEKRLPSIRDLAAEYRVAPNTVAAAIDSLHADGLVRRRRGSGVYVNPLEQLLCAIPFDLPASDPLLCAKETDEPTLHFLFHLDSAASMGESLYAETMVFMQEEAEKAGWRLRLGNAAHIDEILRRATAENTAGVIYMPDIRNPRDLRWPRLDFPRILLSLGEKSLESHYVTPDNYLGGYAAARHLLDRRPTAFAVTAEPRPGFYLGHKPYRERIEGFRDFFRIAGRPDPDVLRYGNDAALADCLDRAMERPAAERPGLLLAGDVPIESVAAFFRRRFPGGELAGEVETIFFQDFRPREKLPYAAIRFSRRTLCREVIDLARRAKRHPEDQPIRVKIPMHVVEKQQ